MLTTWQTADIRANERFSGDHGSALKAIAAKAVVMPSATDLYFPVVDNEIEVAKMPDATCVPIPTIRGHVAGNAVANPVDTAFVNERIAELLTA